MIFFIQVWCCVDKEGILSLPNPSVEKVFFLRTKKSKHKERKHGRARSESSCTWESDSAKGGEAGPESSSDEEEDAEEEEKDEDGAIFVDDKEWGTETKMEAVVYMGLVCQSDSLVYYS